ncbi:hypothetical protein BOX15_Mlig016974g1 [Macrostomum lignano]|uniref:thioredoxin-dependent peroxiredoxin n=1 Tax=Macrostomum lignano TaxID=282301 RepID=A0A267GQX2_9PLAT|nr:hypothetical protein BOX15_Mlig016974g1 [Macrostomum lignano]
MSHFLQPGDLAPPFRSQAVKNGEIVSDFTLEDAMRDAQYLLLVFYPSDFTFVCPTEVQQFADKWTELTEQLKCSTVCCSTDSAFTHLAWLKAPKSERGLGWTAEQAAAGFPVLLSDRTHEIAEAYGVLAPDAGASYRATFLVGPDRRICQASISDMPVGRSVEEAVRLLTEMRAGGGGSLNGGSGGPTGGGVSRRVGRSASSCSRPRLPDPGKQPLMQQRQQPQQPQFRCQSQQQQQYQPAAAMDPYPAASMASGAPFPAAVQSATVVSGGGGGGVGGSGYQCEPQSFNVGQPVCSNLAVEAANLERQAAMLRVRDSEDRLAWMLAETERLRSEAERIRADTERLKNEARRREAEAERVMSCHSACQTVSSSSAAPVSAVSGSGGIAAMTPARAATAGAVDDCSWSTTGMLGAGGGPGCSAGVSQGYRPPPPPPPTQQQPQQQQAMAQSQQLYHHCQPTTAAVVSLGGMCQQQQPQQLRQQQAQLQQQQQQQQQAKSHICRRSSNVVASHIGHKC